MAAVLALLMATTTPAHAPGRPGAVVSPDKLRLRRLVAQHTAGTLTPDEEAELIALLFIRPDSALSRAVRQRGSGPSPGAATSKRT